MKQLILLPLLILSLSAIAQKVDKEGKIEYNGEMVGRVEKGGGTIKSFSLYDANDDEIVTFEPNTRKDQAFRYIVTFLRTNNKGECPGNFSFHKKIAKAFIKSELIKNNTYQYRREARFMSSISGGVYLGGNVDIKPTNNVSNASTEEKLIERNREADIQIFGNIVKQDFKQIARIEKSKNAHQGRINILIKVYNHNNKQIAEASTDSDTNTVYDLVTLKDNKSHQVKAKTLHSITSAIIAKLVALYYL